MKTDNATADDIRFLREAVSKAGTKFRAYRKISIVWGIIIILDGLGSQLLVRTGRTGLIPLIWLPTVAAGIIISCLMGRSIRKKQQMNPVLAGYLALLWFGGIAVILSMIGITFLAPVFSLEYFPALNFPVIALCTLVTAALFKSPLGYVLSGIYFLAIIPATLFPQYSLYLESLLIGGGVLIMGLTKNG